MEKYAYATVATKSIYFPCIIRQAQRMEYLKCKYPFIILITDNIPKEELKILNDNNIKYQIIPYFDYGKKSLEIYYNSNTCYWVDIFLKFETLKLTNYNKILFLDADMILIANIDYIFHTNQIKINNNFLFNIDTMHSAAQGDHFFIKPDKKLYEELHLLVQKVLKQECLDDQDFLSKYFFGSADKIKEFTKNEILHLGGYMKMWEFTTYPFLKYFFYDANPEQFNYILDNYYKKFFEAMTYHQELNEIFYTLGETLKLKQ